MLKSFNTKFTLGVVFTTLFALGSFVTIASADAITPTPTPPIDGTITPEPTITEAPTEIPTEPDGEEEDIPEFGGEDGDGGYIIKIDLDKPAKFIIRVGGDCKAVDNTTVETNKAVSGIIKITAIGNDKISEEYDKVEFCNFELVGFNNDAIEELNWKTKASRDMLLDEGIDKDALKFVLWEDGDPQKYNMKRIDGDSDNYIYTVETDNFGDGPAGIIVEEDGLFTLRNLAICLGSLLAVSLLASAAYALLSRDEGDDSTYDGNNTETDTTPSSTETNS